MKLPKSTYYFALKLLFSFGAYIYIFFKIKKTFFSFEELNAPLDFTAKNAFLIIIVVFLMTLNWLLESIKWKELLSKVEKIKLSKSIKSVLIGITCSIFTPYRLGDYYGRPIVISKEKKTSSVLANILGSICQNIVTLGLGLIGLSILIIGSNQKIIDTGNSLLIVFLIISLIALLIVILTNSEKFIELLNKVKIFDKLKLRPEFLYSYTRKQLSVFLWLSLLRYIVFFSQYFLLLIVFGVKINIVDAFTAISLSYIFLFSIPGIPIADIGIRGSLALFFLGMFSSEQFAILFASTSLWFINIAIPALIGSCFLIKAPKS